jgi:large subunit ribosomal protein L13
MSCGKVIPTIHRWILVDGAQQIVGRLATRITPVLTGKIKPTYSPHVDHGDCVVVINCQHLVFTGDKYEDKRYIWHTGYPGSQRQRSPRYFAEEKGRPEEVLFRAVRGMLPKNKLRNARMHRLTLSKDLKLPAEVLKQFPPSIVKEFNLQLEPKFPIKESTPMTPQPRLFSKSLADELMEARRIREAKMKEAGFK